MCNHWYKYSLRISDIDAASSGKLPLGFTDDSRECFGPDPPYSIKICRITGLSDRGFSIITGSCPIADLEIHKPDLDVFLYVPELAAIFDIDVDTYCHTTTYNGQQFNLSTVGFRFCSVIKSRVKESVKIHCSG